MAPSEDDVSAGSILRELVLNQYQAIVLGGAALASLVALNPLPLLVWLGSELVLLPILDSGPLRRLVHRRRRALARQQEAVDRRRLVAALGPDNLRRYEAMEDLCRHIEANYQSLTGISQVYLSEQRGKLDLILQGILHRMMALQRYERTPASRRPDELEREIADIERELEQPVQPERAVAALRKNLELKQRLLAALSEVDSTIRTLETELDSMASLLEVLHQNSMSLRDPQAISEELDTIVRQSEDSERIVREMEALLRADGPAWGAELPPLARPSTGNDATQAGAFRRKVKGR
jgi:DNA repair exonuclease SbcCD ATPase subunit